MTKMKNGIIFLELVFLVLHILIDIPLSIRRGVLPVLQHGFEFTWGLTEQQQQQHPHQDSHKSLRQITLAKSFYVSLYPFFLPCINNETRAREKKAIYENLN